MRTSFTLQYQSWEYHQRSCSFQQPEKYLSKRGPSLRWTGDPRLFNSAITANSYFWACLRFIASGKLTGVFSCGRRTFRILRVHRLFSWVFEVGLTSIAHLHRHPCLLRLSCLRSRARASRSHHLQLRTTELLHYPGRLRHHLAECLHFPIFLSFFPAL